MPETLPRYLIGLGLSLIAILDVTGAPPALAGDPRSVESGTTLIAAPAVRPIVASSFWSVKMAQDSGVYKYEQDILGAAKIIVDALDAGKAQVGANKADPAKAFLAVNDIKDEIKAKLKAANRSDLVIQKWKNVFNLWLTEVAKRLQGQTKAEQVQTYIDAIDEALQEVGPWALKVDTDKDNKTSGTTPGSADRSTPGSGSSYGYGGLFGAHRAAKIAKLNYRINALRKRSGG